MAENKTTNISDQFNGSPISAAERRVLLLMRQLQAFDVIEIKLHDNRAGEIAIVEKSTAKEIFPVDMV